MRRSMHSLKIGIVASIAVHFATETITHYKAQSIEYWDTSEGEIQLQSKGQNNYRGGFEGNMLVGARSTTGNFTGRWMNSKNNTLRCNYQLNGSYYWRRVVLKFTS